MDIQFGREKNVYTHSCEKNDCPDHFVKEGCWVEKIQADYHPDPGKDFLANQLFFGISGKDYQGKAGEQECNGKVEYRKRYQVRDGRIDREEKRDCTLDNESDVRSSESWVNMWEELWK